MVDKLVTVRLRAAGVGQYTAGMQTAAASTASVTNSLQASAGKGAAAAAGVARFAGIAGKALIVGLGAGLAISAKAAIDFESSFAGVKKTVDTTATGFEILEDGIRDLAKEIPTTVHELARIAELGGQLGIDPDNLITFTEVIAELGATTNLSIEDASMQFARLANILRVPESEFRNMGSVLVDLGNNFATTESEILNFSLRIAPIASVVGMTSDQVMALATALTSVGVPAERGGTAVQKVFTRMAKSVAEGGEELETFGDIAGVTADEFATAFKDDAANAFRMFIEGLGEINAAGGNVFAVLDDVQLSNERTVQSMLALAESSGLLSAALDRGALALANGDALMTEAEKRFATLASQMTLAKNRMTDLRIEIGQGLIPALGDIASDISMLVDVTQRWGGLTKQSTGVVIMVMAGVLIMVKKVTVAMLGAKKAGITMGAAFRKAASRAILLHTALVVATFVLWKMAAAAAETERRTQDLVEALKDERDGIEGVGVAALKATIMDLLPPEALGVLGDMGISVNKIAQELWDLGRAGPVVAAAMRKLIDEQIAFTDSFQGGFTGVLDADQQRLTDTTQAIDALLETFRLWGGALDRNADIIIQELLYAEEKQIAALVAWDNQLGSMILNADRTTESYKRQKAALTELGNGALYSAGQMAVLEDQIRDIQDAELASRDSVFGYMDSIYSLVEAEMALNAEGGNTYQNQMALMKAWNQVSAAARAVGPDGIQPLIRNLAEMQAAGVINYDTYLVLLNLINQFGPIVGTASGQAASLLVGNLGVMSEGLFELGLDISDVVGLMYGMNVAMAATVANTALFSRAVNAAALAAMGGPSIATRLAWGTLAPDTAAIAQQILGSMQSNMAAFNNAYTGIGSNIANQIASGIGSGGSSGSGPIVDAVNNALQDAIDAAKDAVSTVMSTIRSGMSAVSSASRVHDAERDLADLRKENLDLPSQIAAKERELTEARRDAAKVTLEEQKAIEEAEEEFKRTQAAFAQGLISETDLALAEQALNDALRISTAPTDDVKRVEEELNELKARQLELAEDIADAEWAVIDAQIAMIEAQEALIEAGREWIDQGPEGVANFRRIARQAGLTQLEIQNLIDTFAELAEVAYLQAPGTLKPAEQGGLLGPGEPGEFPHYLTDPADVNTSPILGPKRGQGSLGSYPATLSPIDLGSNSPSFPIHEEITTINYNAPGIERAVFRIVGVLDPTNPSAVSNLVDEIEVELVKRGVGGH